LFESWVASEIVKSLVHRGTTRPDVRHYRESRGLEIDIVVERNGVLHLIECKSGATVHSSFADPLLELMESEREGSTPMAPAIVYGGEETYPRRRVPLYGWSDVHSLTKRIVRGT
jgi:predicted AAA+ superfamily ATPase